jgi:methylated-DNA-[protein]-cysteine S-methyltransferase
MTKNDSTFSDRVKEVVKKIPRGKTMSYKEVALLAGNPCASRAVARIMSQNFNPDIPCHRVIRTDGGMGGYNVGVRKRGTLSHEVVDILNKISYNLNSPCNGDEIKRRILQAEGVKF